MSDLCLVCPIVCLYDCPEGRADYEQMCDCGQQSTGGACAQCGAPLCPVCHEVQVDLCSDCVTPEAYSRSPRLRANGVQTMMDLPA